MTDGLDVNRDIFISASAGTGKTYTLVNHYLSIFERSFRFGPSIDVHNVVAITFTRKAAKEMKGRVLKKVDEKIATGVPGDWQGLRSRLIYAWISTIHSFCERIIKESAIFLGIDPGFQVLSGLKRVVKEKNLVRTYFETNIDDLQDLVDLLGVDKTYKLFVRSLSGKRYDLTTGRPFYDLKEIELGADGNRIIPATRAFEKHFIKLVDFYESQTVKEGLVDFDEFMIKTRDLLRDNPQIRDKYEERFKYILVDEFQDTDQLQKEIVDLLHRNGSNHCFFVGDAKQSIYRFRGADVTVFNKTRQTFLDQKLTIKELDTNWRSHPDLVDFQNRLFGKIMQNDYSGEYFKTIYNGEIKSIASEETVTENRIKLLLNNSSGDAKGIAAYIKNLLGRELTFRKKDGTCERRGIKPGDIAILLRKFTNVGSYESSLEEQKIPFYTIGNKNFYDRPEIAGPLAWLDIIVDPLDDISFVTFLTSPCFNATIEEIAIFKGKDKHVYDALMKTGLEKFTRLREFYADFSSFKHVLSPSLILDKFIQDTDYMAKLGTLPDAERMVANVKKMLEIAKELDILGTSLRELSSNLKAFVDSSEESEATIENEESNSVKLMTVHKSKGLEFPVVIVADTFWTEKRTDESNTILFKDGKYILTAKKPEKSDETVLSKLYRQKDSEEREEEKRTLYVALSRPRELLILSLNGKVTATKPWASMLAGSLFNIDDDKMADEVCDDLLDLVETVRAREETAPACLQIEEAPPGIPDLEMIVGLEDDSYVRYLSPTLITDDTVEFTTSGTAVGDLLERNPAEIGTLAHSMLEQLGNHTYSGVVTLAGITAGGNSTMVDEIRFTPEDVGAVKETFRALSGKEAGKIIEEIEENDRVYSEFQVQRTFEKYVLVGIVDKIYSAGGRWRIADFKFARKNPENLDKYRFQMKFYLYVLQKLFHPEKATIVYLKDGKTEEVFLDDPEKFERELLGKINSYETKGVVK